MTGVFAIQRLLQASMVAATALMAASCGSTTPTTPPPPPPVVQQPPAEPPVAPTPPPTLAKTTILAFGDSMTEGIDSPQAPFEAALWTLPLNAGRPQSYPFKLKALVDARYTSQSIGVLNGGLAGRAAREDLERFRQALSEGRPDLVLLMEGANDLNSPPEPGEGINARIAAVVSALEDFVREAAFRNVPVMIATLPPQRPNGPKAGGIEYLPRFNDAVRVMAGKKGAEVVEVAQVPVSLIGQDGLHPSEAGYQRIAEIWFDAIRARYEKIPE